MKANTTELDPPVTAPGRTRGRGRAGGSGNGRRTNGRSGILFTLPALVAMAAVIAYPLLWAFDLSFKSLDLLKPGSPSHYVGLDNYRTVLSSGEFRNALLLTIGFVVLTIVLELALGMAIALLLNQNMRGMGKFRLIFSLPLLMAPSVAGLQFRFLFEDQYGAINAILKSIGIDGPLWLVDVVAARAAILLSNLWLATPFVVLVLLAGMANLPDEPFEAARLDGAGPFQVFRHIMLPMLRPAILVILVIRLADAFRVFDLVYILTGGGPGHSTDVLSTYIYRETFVRADFAGGAAASFVLVAIVAVLSFLSLRLLRPRG
jgi:multiple sugar transport system permease protein